MKIKIADINIEILGEIYDYFKYRVHKYIISEDEKCDVVISYRENDNILVPDGEIIGKQSYKVFGKGEGYYFYYDILNKDKNSALIVADDEWTKIECELYDVEDFGGASLSIRQFNMIGFVVKYIMINRCGMSLHSSSLAYKNSGIMFSANSGTGKSTHTGLWQETFENVEIINDDMPAIRKQDGNWYLYGCPWSGKTEKNLNKRVPLKALVFLERGQTNEIERIYAPECVYKILNQTIVPPHKEFASKAMSNIGDLVRDIPIYRLKCTISKEAPMVVAKELGLL